MHNLKVLIHILVSYVLNSNTTTMYTTIISIIISDSLATIVHCLILYCLAIYIFDNLWYTSLFCKAELEGEPRA